MVELAVLERLYGESHRGFESPSLLIHIKRIPYGYPFNMMLESRGFEGFSRRRKPGLLKTLAKVLKSESPSLLKYSDGGKSRP